MTRRVGQSAWRPLSLVAACALIAATSPLSGQSGLPSTKNGEWTHYTADVRGSRYSPLDQINATNFNQLEVAWRFKTDNLGTRPEFKLEGTPLMVKGVIYATGGTRRSVVALDARTGELIWVHAEREGARAVNAPRQLSGRGLSYWTDGRGDERVLYVTTGYRLVALNAKTGTPVQGFGKDGVVDMKVGALIGKGEQINLETGEIGLHSTPTVAKDVVIVGSSFREGLTVKSHNNTKGLVRAWDVRNGKLLWTFNTIPRPGEFGNDTWEKESWAINGNTGVWSQITVDEELGLVYLPVEDPTSDLYGGHRPGNNLFGDSIVCLDLKTGQRKWYFQIVHHPIWDLDMPAAPLLMDLVVDGRPVKAVAQATKQGMLYVFDRVTGKPVWPIEERPVPQTDVPGEKTSPTQPFPTKPPAYSRNGVLEGDLVDFTPEIKAQALEVSKRYRLGPVYLPPLVSKAEGPLAALTAGTLSGGVNWPGSAYDPEMHVFFTHACNSCIAPLGLVAPPKEFSDLDYVMGTAGQTFRPIVGGGEGEAADAPRQQSPARGATPPPAPAPPATPPAGGAAAAGGGRGGAGGGPFGATVQGLNIVKPPYGLMVAINMDKGDLMWSVPHGDTPDGVRNHPSLKGVTVPKTGQQGNVGIVVTKTLVVAGDPLVTTTPDHPRGGMLRAYDKQTGKEVGAVFMPAAQSGSPMTYMVDGKQYIVVAVSGGNYSGEYIAYSLPATALRPTNQQ
ncbi:MAG TPA: PQQ-binding-like beta-propeller repeat protein [Vicinamibacterales bacterium]|jgi:quinoprotein glucose dehydrogenase|nr:PQQ-binding-like beta-propeller repeat protein [Vicinamibacterales bacterium]